jgi:LETM1 and EF-hand domain-containing protein 1, mitochondrial
MSVNAAAVRIAPAVLRSAPRNLARGRNLPQHISAVAILLPRRHYAPEPTTSTGGGANLPPPGFNAAEAKKPLKQSTPETAQNAGANKSKAVDPDNTATAEPKGKATDFDTQSHSQLLSEEASAESAEPKDKDALEMKKKEEKKLTLWQKVKKEANHYWDGTKLLATEVKISSRLALKMAAGYELTRRENRQVSICQRLRLRSRLTYF